MQAHWVKWGPPAYIGVSQYLKLGTAYKKNAPSKSSTKDGLPDKPEHSTGESKQPKGGDLNELVSFLGGPGAIRA